MNTTPETAGAPALAPAARSFGLINTLVMLGRRELWEHRGLWLAPLVVAGILLAACIAAILYSGQVCRCTARDIHCDNR